MFYVNIMRIATYHIWEIWKYMGTYWNILQPAGEKSAEKSRNKWE